MAPPRQPSQVPCLAALCIPNHVVLGPPPPHPTLPPLAVKFPTGRWLRWSTNHGSLTSLVILDEAINQGSKPPPAVCPSLPPLPASPPRGLVPLLGNIERIGVVSTYGAAHWAVAASGDGGRRMWSQALRPLFAPLCPLRWLGLYEADAAPPEERAAFLEKVEETYRRF